MRPKRLLSTASATLLLLAIATPAKADVFTWTGLGNTSNWSEGANWAGGNPPPASDPATSVVFGGMLSLNPRKDFPIISELNQITFSPDAGGFNLRGLPIALSANGNAGPAITNNATTKAPQTISFDQTFLESPATIRGTGTADLLLAGTIIGGQGLTFDAASFTVRFTGNTPNGYGGTTINAGNVVLQKGAASVTAIPGDLVIGTGGGPATASVTMRDFSQQISTFSNVTVNANGTLTLSSEGRTGKSFGVAEQIATLSGSGTVDLGAGMGGGRVPNPGTQTPRNTLFTDGKPGASFDGRIIGGGNLNKIGSGTLILNGTNASTGDTRVGLGPSGSVPGGTLTVNGSIGTRATHADSVRVVQGTLNGTGTIFATETRGVTVEPGGRIKPGKSPGILTIGSGGFLMEAGSVFDEEISRSPSRLQACSELDCYSRLVVSGGTELQNSTLAVTLDAPPVFTTDAMNPMYGIIDNLDGASVIGTFEGLPPGGTVSAAFGGTLYNFEISYDGVVNSSMSGLPLPNDVLSFHGGNDVVLRVIGRQSIPEPSSTAMLLAGLAALLRVRARASGPRHPPPSSNAQT